MPKMPVQTNTTAKHEQVFGNNRYVDSLTGKTYATENSSTGEMICRHASQVDVNEAVLSAKNAFKSNSVWRRMNATARARLLCKLADLIERDIDRITVLEKLSNQIGFSVAYNRVQQSLQCVRYIAAMCDKLHGKAIPIVGPYFAFTRLEPIGVCGSVFQGNCSVIILAIQIGVALSAGNTIVIECAEQTRFTALHLSSLIVEAGFPPGVVNIISGCDQTVCTAAVFEHNDIKKVVLYGSNDGENRNQFSGENAKCKRVMIEMLPTVTFGHQNTFNAVQNSIKLLSNERQILDEQCMVDESVKRSIELAAKRVFNYPNNNNNNNNNNTERSSLQIDFKHFNKIVSYIILFTEKCILV